MISRYILWFHAFNNQYIQICINIYERMAIVVTVCITLSLKAAAYTVNFNLYLGCPLLALPVADCFANTQPAKLVQ